MTGVFAAFIIAQTIILTAFVLAVNDTIDLPTQAVITILAIAVQIVLLQIWGDR
jgi:hypothetical protein